MTSDKAGNIKITLCGDWSMSGVSNQVPRLVEQMASISALASEKGAACQAGGRPELVMTGIGDFDASGCQLLALFVRLLQGKGVMPLLTEVPEAIMGKIRLLGFAGELAACLETGEQNA
jgi:ABC-type transporter Mla MlaB component